MPRTPGIALSHLGVLAATALLLAACGSSTPSFSDPADEVTATTSSAAADRTPTTASAPTAPATTTTVAVPGVVIQLEVGDNGLEGGPRRESVALGEEVTLEISSSIAEEIHVHGYDLVIEVAAGEPASATFPATIPGVFEVELEGSGQLLINLEVS